LGNGKARKALSECVVCWVLFRPLATHRMELSSVIWDLGSEGIGADHPGKRKEENTDFVFRDGEGKIG